MEMKAKTAGWSRRYQTALRRHLKNGTASSLQPALKLGRQAAALGLETLDLAQVHEQALASTVLPPGGNAKSRKRWGGLAKRFFAEAIVPIEETHAAAQQAGAQVNQLTRDLRKRTVESATSTRKLKRSIAKRKEAEAALEKSGADRTKLLQASTRMHTQLREQTRALLAAQEAERQKTSLQLQDEVAQALLAISIRLLALKTAAKASTDKFSKEIANTQRLVRESLKKVNGVRV